MSKLKIVNFQEILKVRTKMKSDFKVRKWKKTLGVFGEKIFHVGKLTGGHLGILSLSSMEKTQAAVPSPPQATAIQSTCGLFIINFNLKENVSPCSHTRVALATFCSPFTLSPFTTLSLPFHFFHLHTVKVAGHELRRMFTRHFSFTVHGILHTQVRGRLGWD